MLNFIVSAVLLDIQSFFIMPVCCIFNPNSNNHRILKHETVKLASNVQTIYLTF